MNDAVHNDLRSVFAKARAMSQYPMTLAAATRVIDLVLAGSSRASIRAELAETLSRSRLRLSSNSAKAVDSMTDVTLTAKRHGLIDAPDGIPKAFLAELMALLYLDRSPSVRIDKAELTHVPIVVEGATEIFRRRRLMKEKPATTAELTVVFLAALLHDAGKWDVNVRTVRGLTFGKDSPHNPYRQPVEMLPGESMREALNRASLDPARLSVVAMMLVPVLAHPDSYSVKALVEELRAEGRITNDAANTIWKCVNAQAFVSSWTVRNSLSETSLRSHIFDPSVSPDARRFLELYPALTDEIRFGKTPEELADTALFPESAAKLDALRAECDRLPDAQIAFMLGDHQGQNDIVKYLDIQTAKPASERMTMHQLLFGCGAHGLDKFRHIAHWMENSIRGVLLTHAYEQRLIDPELGAWTRRGFDRSIAWLDADSSAPGLVQAILADETLAQTYRVWRADRQPGESTSVPVWLDTIPVFLGGQRTETYLRLRRRIETAFYNYYAPAPETGAPSLFTRE
jgi:hypothetical protein